ncbi:beta-galactosidase [Mesobacillus foraminis]|uniref:beta-galactosidase n=1 Tax=Mesobacillus foraminis TaxID=279826 RepID=UPI000EF51262|nr:beta-galactosidase [Mesobacillus foraminis]
MGKKLYHGAAYYPELWDRFVIDQDLQLMKETGINAIRMGEFAWSTLEPEEGKIDVSFFAELINKFYENGIETVMCTPTPTPPIWMTHGFPERLFVDMAGRRMGHGSRQHICTNNQYFRERAAIIAEKLAKGLGSLPGLIGWQLDNEFKAHVNECTCDTCKELWHNWLREKYRTIGSLNNDWKTGAGQPAYRSFEEVPVPENTASFRRLPLRMAYRQFSMEKIAEFADEQAEVIRQYSKAPITHNSSIGFHVDNERLFKNLDFASFDTYATIEHAGAYLINCDIWRNLKKDKGFWIMETSPSFSASLEGTATPHPNGYLKAEAAAAYALGSEAFCYWLWRQQRTGCEQPHGSVISAWGKPAIGYENVLEVERMREALEPILLSSQSCQAEVALVYSDHAKAYFQNGPFKKLNYRGVITEFYQQILSNGIHRDVIQPGADLEGYKLLFTPYLPSLPADAAERARQFAEKGGIWITGPLTGDGGTAIPEDDDELVSEQKYGEGKIVQLHFIPKSEEEKKRLEKIIDQYANEAGVDLRMDISPGTIAIPRKAEGNQIWVMVNMDGNGGEIDLPFKGYDLISECAVPCGRTDIGKFEYKVLQSFKSHSPAVS